MSTRAHKNSRTICTTHAREGSIAQESSKAVRVRYLFIGFVMDAHLVTSKQIVLLLREGSWNEFGLWCEGGIDQ